jgi:hypothetical protein
MARDEGYPTPLLNMSPSGIPGFLVVVLIFLGIWSLCGPYFVIGLALMSVIALASVFIIRNWRANHPRGESVLHLETRSDEKGENA